MRVLFIGLLYNPAEERFLLSMSSVGLSSASNVLEWNIIRGLSGILGNENLDVVASVPAGNYPWLNRRLIYSDSRQSYESVDYDELGFINTFFLKHWQRKQKLRREIKQWLARDPFANNVVIFYDLYSPFLDMINELREVDSVRTCLIVPDLAGKYRNDVERGRIAALIGNFRASRKIAKAEQADFHVFLTEQMADIIASEKYVVIDGVIDERQPITSMKKTGKCVFMYAGALSHEYGIDLLIESFKELDLDNIELWFCGKGSMESFIREASSKDERIKYFGYLDKVRLGHTFADVNVCINPRYDSGEFTKYSFPSKNLEYALAGRPVICFKLRGMSDDYDDIFYYVANNTKDDLQDVLVFFAQMNFDELERRGVVARNFVIEHNNSFRQAEKILTLVER